MSTMDFFEPRISADMAPWWEGCRAHELRFQKCKHCGKVRWPASYVCPECLSEAYEQTVLPNQGTLYSFVVMYKPFHPSLQEKVPYVIGAVDLEEDVRISVNMFDVDPDSLHCGMPVDIVFEDSETYSRPIAKLKGER